MGGVVTWRADDIALAVIELNANASTFSGFIFDGWHAMGDDFIAPEPEGSQPVAFGRVALGQSITFSESSGGNTGLDAPFRVAAYVLEVFMTRNDRKVWVPVLRTALSALVNSLTDFGIQAQEWQGPDPSDLPGNPFPNFNSVSGVVPYTQGLR